MRSQTTTVAPTGVERRYDPVRPRQKHTTESASGAGPAFQHFFGGKSGLPVTAQTACLLEWTAHQVHQKGQGMRSMQGWRKNNG